MVALDEELLEEEELLESLLPLDVDSLFEPPDELSDLLEPSSEDFAPSLLRRLSVR